MYTSVRDDGHEFEQRALAIARAIYDPSGTQGSVMFQGKEHDGVFVDERSVVAFEFTQMQKKDKALGDAEKVRNLLQFMSKMPENRYKAILGFVVTMTEPTAEQRKAVDQVASRAGMSIKVLSVVTLRGQLIDSERYLSLRLQAPFGSTAYRLPSHVVNEKVHYVEPSFAWETKAETCVSLEEIVSDLQGGSRYIVTADFGAGKSEALRQAFLRLRKSYFKDPTGHRMPLHINLKDCYGLRTPREILRRHAEELGFPHESSLVAAWRSGNCVLLLDGFDELVPSRWVGGAKDLRSVRWSALEALRTLVRETPDLCGILIAGRPQYFADTQELADCMAMNPAHILRLLDLDDDGVAELVPELAASLPAWVPARPLMLRFLAESGLLDQVRNESPDPAAAWGQMLDMLTRREADRVTAVTAPSIRSLLGRVATLARSCDGGLGPISIDDMRSAFRDVCGYEADEEGLQLLLRLPGLASVPGPIGRPEMRTFVDAALAEVAYGEDLATYISAPFEDHPLATGVSWTSAAIPLAASVAGQRLLDDGYDRTTTVRAVKRRMDLDLFDAVLLDAVLVADELIPDGSVDISPFFSDLLISCVTVTGSAGLLARSTFKECIIERLVVTDAADAEEFPSFQSCVIGLVDGWSKIPAAFESQFVSCEIDGYSQYSDTTSGLLELPLSLHDRVALVILKKVYLQSGSGRKELSLARGLPPEARGSVSEIVDDLVSENLVGRASGRNSEPLIVPVRSARVTALQYLQEPMLFGRRTVTGRKKAKS